jgi:Uncharacterized protein conserved in bacteria (DUF2147)
MRYSFVMLCTFGLTIAQARAQTPTGEWISEGERGRIEIYTCETPGHDVRDAALLSELCSYVKDGGPRLCGRIVQILPKGLDELKSKGQKEEDEPRQAMLCVARSADTKWPWKGGVYKPDDGKTYWLRLAPDGTNKLKGSGCGLGGFVCPSSGEFVWSKAGG